MDRMLAGANRAADYTVFVSEWLRDYHDSRWFDAAKPHSVILNGADPSIFHPLGAAAWREDRPLRLVTHHWSDNMSKGFRSLSEDRHGARFRGAPGRGALGDRPLARENRVAKSTDISAPASDANWRICCVSATGMLPRRDMNPEPCIRSRAFNAGFHCFIIVRPEELWSLVAATGWNYPTIP